MLFITSLKQVLSKNFIIGLGTNSTTGSIVESLRGGGKSDVEKVTLGLRRGAALYANSIGKLNAVGTVLNTSKALMENLSKLTDEMTTIVTRATKASTTNSTRARLDREFKGLVNEFRETIENAKIDDKEILTKEGLIEFFTNVGLDPESSARIADVFEKFVVPSEEDLFASEEVKGAALKLPAAENAPTPSPTYFLNQVTDSSGTLTVGGIASNTNIVVDSADYLGQNPNGVRVPYIIDEAGNLKSIPSDKIASADVSVLAVTESSGYSVVRSASDFLGFNGGGGKEVLYLMSPDGEILHQISTDDAGDFAEVDIGYDSDEGKYRIVFTSNQDLTGGNADLGEEAFFYEFRNSQLGADPALQPPGLEQISSGSAAAQAGNIRISENGEYVAYNYTDGTAQIKMYEVSSGNTGSVNNVSRVVGFSDSDTIVTAGATRFNYIDYATPALTNAVLYVPEGGAMPGTTQAAVSENGFLAYFADSNDNVYLVDVGAGPTSAETVMRTLGSSDTVSYMTVAANGGSTVDVGVFGLVREFDTVNNQLYRIREGIPNTGDVLSKPTTVDKIFDGSIRRREDAFRTLNDLTALRDQIKDNIDAVDDALEFLQQNIDLVRAAGLAFLDLSEEISTEQQAEDVARLVEREIRLGAPANALKHAENLSPIAVAALVGTGDDDE